MRPMRLHVGGTMLAVALSIQHGWAVNLGGGMHHAHYDVRLAQCVPASNV
jgi:histone deacetylase 11